MRGELATSARRSAAKDVDSEADYDGYTPVLNAPTSDYDEATLRWELQEASCDTNRRVAFPLSTGSSR